MPAIWTEEARSLLRSAAFAAGLTNLQLGLEPLCAAALIMPTMLERRALKVISIDTEPMPHADGV